MKNIYLIGDSIRFGAPGSDGYGMHVKEKLQGKANVYAPNENCRFAQYTLRYLPIFLKYTLQISQTLNYSSLHLSKDNRTQQQVSE